MSYKIFLDGGAGTTGLQIADRLAVRNDIEILVLGEEERKQTAARKAAMAEADITILCLPDEAAIEAVQMAAELQGNIRRDIRLIDACVIEIREHHATFGVVIIIAPYLFQ